MKKNDWWFNKIWGCWTGKIAGGTYGMPVEGKTKEPMECFFFGSPSLYTYC